MMYEWYMQMDWKEGIFLNEKQRLETQQLTAEKPADKKSEKDYSKYFQAVYVPPSLKDAKKRGKEEVKYDQFAIPEQLSGMGEGRKFYIRTYGCQMNEHDTEVMAGIFMALGYEPQTQWTMPMSSYLIHVLFEKMQRIKCLGNSVI